jgi:hypothetical protein
MNITDEVSVMSQVIKGMQNVIDLDWNTDLNMQ